MENANHAGPHQPTLVMTALFQSSSTKTHSPVFFFLDHVLKLVRSSKKSLTRGNICTWISLTLATQHWITFPASPLLSTQPTPNPQANTQPPPSKSPPHHQTRQQSPPKRKKNPSLPSMSKAKKVASPKKATDCLLQPYMCLSTPRDPKPWPKRNKCPKPLMHKNRPSSKGAGKQKQREEEREKERRREGEKIFRSYYSIHQCSYYRAHLRTISARHNHCRMVNLNLSVLHHS